MQLLWLFSQTFFPSLLFWFSLLSLFFPGCSFIYQTIYLGYFPPPQASLSLPPSSSFLPSLPSPDSKIHIPGQILRLFCTHPRHPSLSQSAAWMFLWIANLGLCLPIVLLNFLSSFLVFPSFSVLSWLYISIPGYILGLLPLRHLLSLKKKKKKFLLTIKFLAMFLFIQKIGNKNEN